MSDVLTTKVLQKTDSPLPKIKPHDLLDVQLKSWTHFWDELFPDLLKESSPIKDHSGRELELNYAGYRMEDPLLDEFEARAHNASFEATVRLVTRLTNKKTGEVKEQEVYLCEFPLMTTRGTFIVNGVERVIIPQIIRSPGVYFKILNTRGGRSNFGAQIIPNRGAWLEFETDSAGVINVKIDRHRKIPSTVLLRALGASEEEMRGAFKGLGRGGTDFLAETFKKDKTKSQDEALVAIYENLRPGDPVNIESARSFFNGLLETFGRYDLARVGRWKIEIRLTGKGPQVSDIKISDRLISKNDILRVVAEIMRLNNDPDARPDEIDHLGNRRVRTFGELLEQRLRLGFTRMERIVRERMSTFDIATATPVQLVNSRPVVAAVREFFSSSQLSQFMDNVNPLAELEHKRRVSAMGPGGLTRERAGFDVRDVQPSHYGRICPIQTPEGPNVGLVGYLAMYSRINDFGFIETPYFKVKNGYVSDEIVWLDASTEENKVIAHGGTKLDTKKRIVEDYVEARFKGEPQLISKDRVELMDIAPQQALSTAAALIPFLEHNDASRALMAANMQRQAVPCVKPKAPLVATGIESIAARESGQVVLAKEDGVVDYVDAERISVRHKDGISNYTLRAFVRSNQYTIISQRPVISLGQKIKKGDVLAEGSAVDNGELALGQNLTVAFIPWRGANYEDAIVVSQRLVEEDIFTSIRIEDFVCDVRDTKLGPEVTTPDIPNVGDEKLKDLDEKGIVRVGAEVGPGDILVGKISPKGETDLTAEERLLRAIFGEKARDVRDTSLRMPHGKRGRVVSVKVFSRERGDALPPGVIYSAQVEVASLRRIAVGDKLAGRHGNKGVISQILPKEEMPFLEDGTPVDIILNPLGVVSRMNLGQIFETHLGAAAKNLNFRAYTPALNGASMKNIQEWLKEAGLSETGKVILYDGETGQPFKEPVTVGVMYVMKLVHMVEDKIHMRSIGPYSLITQQPLGGKAQFGGQRFGEMEVWALEGFGAAHTLQEMLTVKSDDIAGRSAMYEAIIRGQPLRTPNIPASFNVLTAELRSLGFEISLNRKHKELLTEVRETEDEKRQNKKVSAN